MSSLRSQQKQHGFRCSFAVYRIASLVGIVGVRRYAYSKLDDRNLVSAKWKADSRMRYDTNFKSVRDEVSPEEWQARLDLAACYRLVDASGMTDLIYNHITARV